MNNGAYKRYRMTRWNIKDEVATTTRIRSDLEDGGIKVRPWSRLQSNVLTCKLVRLVRPVDSGNCRRSPPKTSIPAATSGRPPVRQSALPSDHFGKGCSSVVLRFFRSVPVAASKVYVFMNWHMEHPYTVYHIFYLQALRSV